MTAEHGDVEVADYSQLPSEPVVSVCMITYNHAVYLREALDSVLMQRTDFPVEICIGEDGSTDGTREICLEYVERHPDRIRLFLRNRMNPARKKYSVPFMHNGLETLRACRGRYVALLEGDDLWTSSQKLRRQVATLEAEPSLSVCAHGAIVVPENPRYRPFRFPPTPIERFDLDYFLIHCFFLATCSMMYRRTELPPNDVFERAMAGDTLLTAFHLSKGGGVVLPEVMSIYRQHSRGASTGSAGYRPDDANMKQWQLFRDVFPAYRGSIQRGYTEILSRSIYGARRSGQWREVFRLGRILLREVQAMKDSGLGVRVGALAKAGVGVAGLLEVADSVSRRLNN